MPAGDTAPTTAPPPTGLWSLAVAGLAVTLVTLGGLMAWSATAPLSSAALASGTVVVDSNRKAVQHLEGGTIKAILVKDGDRVAAGQPVVELDDAALSRTLAALRPLVWINAAQRARLAAERDGADDIAFPSELLDAKDQVRRSIVADQRRSFAARRAALESRRAVLANQREQAEAVIDGLRRQLGSQRERMRLTQKERAGADRLAGAGHGTAIRVLELDRASAELDGEEARLRSKLDETRKQAEFNTLEIKRVTDAFAEAVEAETQTVEKERYDLTERLQQASEQLDRLRVVAPVAGKVVNRSVHTVGGVVAPRATLLEIVPEDDPLVIEARVRPVDVEGLEVGAAVEIRFPGIHAKLLPRLHGRLATVSADLLVDEAKGSPYFAARVRVDDDALRVVGHRSLRPGMPVEVMLVKRPRTVIGYLTEPLVGFFDRAMRE